MRSTVKSHLYSLERFSNHQFLYLNSLRPNVPRYIQDFNPDVVIFHYTFMSQRSVPSDFEEQRRRLDYLKQSPARKVVIAQDEQTRSDLLSDFVNDFGVQVVLTPAPASEYSKIYRGVDFEKVTFKTVLTGYVDESAVRKTARLAKRHHGRPIDIGYRSWDPWPFYGRHGRLKGEVGHVFAARAPEYGLKCDISNDYRDAIVGDAWFDFLLNCKYTIGVEGGTSIIDRDGSIATRTFEYMRAHPDASFEQIEAACFPGLDGEFAYYAVSPRHFEAVMTRTCQILIEGEYGGALEAGKHYIPLKRDFSNLDDVLATMKRDDVRQRLVEQAYQDVIASERWTYGAFTSVALDAALSGLDASASKRRPYPWFWTAWNPIDNELWSRKPTLPSLKWLLMRTAWLVLGEERVWRLLVGRHNLVRRMKGLPLIERNEFVHSHYWESYRAEKQRKKAAKSA